MRAPTLPDLYLAYRQAKTALYFERRGVGLIELAQFEEQLPENLAALLPKLASDAWFDNLNIGEVWVVPKRLRDGKPRDKVVRIGTPNPERPPRPLNIQLRLSPSPEFAIAEMLYLQAFGPMLDRQLSTNVLGYRLDLRHNELGRYRRWSFEYWPKQYRQYREEPLREAREALAKGESVLIVSADLASFYDSVDPAFLLFPAFLRSLLGRGAQDLSAYKVATKSLLRAIKRFRAVAGDRIGLPLAIGVPIGSLTSRVIANASLATMDAYVEQNASLIAYRRYVDDIVIVARSSGDVSVASALRRFLPVTVSRDLVTFDTDTLDRPGSQFTIQNEKVRVHQLHGLPGEDFVNAVLADFDRVVSRSQAFVDETALLRDHANHLVRAGSSGASPLRVLRDADRVRMEDFSLSTSLRTLERVSMLAGPKEALEVVRDALSRIGRVLDDQGDWVENLDTALRMLALALSTNDQSSVEAIVARMEDVFGTEASLRTHVTLMRYGEHDLEPTHRPAWSWLRNYLHARRLEACVSAIRPRVGKQEILPDGLRVRRGRIEASELRTRAQELANADLRSYDREDDSFKSAAVVEDDDLLEAILGLDEELIARLAVIRTFVEKCSAPEDSAWRMPATRLFLCTRPPSYFDVARRWLEGVEWSGFATDVFDTLMGVVNAIRGTSHRDPLGEVRDPHTVHIPWSDDERPYLPDPTLVLGNLSVGHEHWDAAASRRKGARLPNRDIRVVRRMIALSHVLTRAKNVAHRVDVDGFLAPTLLVLPELTIPRRWLRMVSNHIVRDGVYGAVLGLEYKHVPSTPYVLNQACAVLPSAFGSVATWTWTKRRPSREEGIQLKQRHGVEFPPVASDPPGTVVATNWGRFSTLICSELFEARRVADLLGRAELVLCPAWNVDTSSYDHLIQSVGFQLHAIVAIANNGHYSDCRAWAPYTERWKRDLCRLIERDANEIVSVTLPLQELIAFHLEEVAPDLAECGEGCEPKKPLWRPLPPNWPPHGP